MKDKPAELATIDSGYRLDLDSVEWLSTVAARTSAALGNRFRVAAWTYEATRSRAVVVREIGSCGVEAAQLESLAAVHSDQAVKAELWSAYAIHPPVETLTEVGATNLLAALSQVGIGDLIGMSGSDPTGSGIGLAVLLDEPTRISDRFRRRWTRVTAHLAAGLRLRRTLTRHHDCWSALPHFSDNTGAGRVEAILSPQGELHHAEDCASSPSMRVLLRKAAVAFHHASSRVLENTAQDGVDASIEAWKALAGGRWTLVDQFNCDGSHYIVARRNDPTVASEMGSLTPREQQVIGYRALGHSLKVIAYELGLSLPTISRTLKSAMRQLGVTDHLQLASAAARARR